MNLFEFADNNLSVADWSLQLTHMSCVIVALFIGMLPLLAAKGSRLHREAGQIYIVCAMLAFGFGMAVAARQGSVLLACCNGFFAWLLLSGWRALYRREAGALDWGILGILSAVCGLVVWAAAMQTDPRAALALGLFAFGSGVTILREAQELLQPRAARGWMARHVAGMAGSLMANFSVVAMAFLPPDMTWMLPASLGAAAAAIGLRRTLMRWMRVRRMEAYLDPQWHLPKAR